MARSTIRFAVLHHDTKLHTLRIYPNAYAPLVWQDEGGVRGATCVHRTLQRENELNYALTGEPGFLTVKSTSSFALAVLAVANTAGKKCCEATFCPLQKQLPFVSVNYFHTLRATEGISAFSLLPHTGRQLSVKACFMK